ncbi:hypothetical protein Esti_004100 [Eimeria stiedai]
MEAGGAGAGGPRGPRGSRAPAVKEPEATLRVPSIKASGGGGGSGGGSLVLPRRKRSGIMTWLVNPFGRKQPGETPKAAAAGAAAGEGGVSAEQAGEETSSGAAAAASSLRSAASLLSIARISGGRLAAGGGGARPPVFERRRRRHKTVVWRYKKTIGLFASFVFISNQILASGLLGMPSLVRAAGPLSASAVIVVFCGISSACALLLLKSMTLIEGNANFSERFEYSAILRYFLSVSPPEPAASLLQQEEQQEGGADAGDNPRKQGVAALLDRALYEATGLGASGREAEGEADEAPSKLSPYLSRGRLQGILRLLQQGRALPLLRETMGGWWLRWNRTSLSQGIAFLLYASSFLSASSAALLIAYCLDALLLRVLGWTLFVRLLPCGAPNLGSNLLQLGSNLVESVSLLSWPLRGIVVGLWRLQGIVSSHGGDSSVYNSQEALQEWDVGPQFNPFVFVTSPQQLEEIFSGVCACQETEAAAAAAAAAEGAAAACMPCLNYIGVSLGYMLTAAAGLHLAASDLEDTMRLQFVSFFAVVAAVLNVSVIACVRLSSGEGWQPLGPHEPAAAAQAAAAAAAEAQGAGGSYAHPALSGAGATETARPEAAPPAAGDSEGRLLHLLRWVFGGIVARTAIPSMVDAFGYSSSLPSWANEVQDEVPISRTVWLSSLFSAFFFCLFGCLCATAFVGAAESSNALASLLHAYSEGPFPLAAAAFICFFHVAALLPSIVLAQISSRLLRAASSSKPSHNTTLRLACAGTLLFPPPAVAVAAAAVVANVHACVCCRCLSYDLLNMAICLEKKSAFRIASTVPWLSYWLLSYQPLFAQPASTLAFVIGLILNFLIPLCTFIYASFYADLLSASSQQGAPLLSSRGALGSLADPGREDAAAAAAAAAAVAAGASTAGGLPLLSLGSVQLRDSGGSMGLGGPRGGAPAGERGGPSRGIAFAAVSGAVAGAGGARTREMQRQLHQWLVEFARRAPDSDVAQLLQREQQDASEETADAAAAAAEDQITASHSMEEGRGASDGLRTSGSIRGRASRSSSKTRELPLFSSEAAVSFPLLRGASSPSLCSSPAFSDSPGGSATAAEAAAAWRTGDNSTRSLGSPWAWNRGGSSSRTAPLVGDRTPDAAQDAAAARAAPAAATAAGDTEMAAAGTKTAAAQAGTETTTAEAARDAAAAPQPAGSASAAASEPEAAEANQEATSAAAAAGLADAAAAAAQTAAGLEAAADTTVKAAAAESAAAAAEEKQSERSSASAPSSLPVGEGAEAAEQSRQEQQQEQEQPQQQQQQERQQEEASKAYVRSARRLRPVGRFGSGGGWDRPANTIPAHLSDDPSFQGLKEDAAAEGVAAGQEASGAHEQQQQSAAPRAGAAAAVEGSGVSLACETQEEAERGEETARDDPAHEPAKNDDSSSSYSSGSDSSSSSSNHSTRSVSAASSSTATGMEGLDSASEARHAEDVRAASAEEGDSRAAAAAAAVFATDEKHSLLLPIVRVTAATAAAARAAAAAADATAAASAAAADFAAAAVGAATAAAAAQPGNGGGLRRRPRSKAIRPSVSHSLLQSPASPSNPTPDTSSFSNTTAAAAEAEAAATAAAAEEGVESTETAAAGASAGEGVQPPPVFTRSRRRGLTARFNLGDARSPEASSSTPPDSAGKTETAGDNLRKPVEDDGFKTPAEKAAAAADTPQPAAETPEATKETPQAVKGAHNAAGETPEAAGERRSAAGGPIRRSLWSGWTLSGLRYVAMSPARWRGAARLRRRENGSTGRDPRVTPFPCLKTPRSERLAAFCLLLLVAACAFVAVAEDLIDAACFSVSLLKQLLNLSRLSAVQLCNWLLELATEDPTSYLPEWLAACTAS